MPAGIFDAEQTREMRKAVEIVLGRYEIVGVIVGDEQRCEIGRAILHVAGECNEDSETIATRAWNALTGRRRS